MTTINIKTQKIDDLHSFPGIRRKGLEDTIVAAKKIKSGDDPSMIQAIHDLNFHIQERSGFLGRWLFIKAAILRLQREIALLGDSNPSKVNELLLEIKGLRKEFKIIDVENSRCQTERDRLNALREKSSIKRKLEKKVALAEAAVDDFERQEAR